MTTIQLRSYTGLILAAALLVSCGAPAKPPTTSAPAGSSDHAITVPPADSAPAKPATPKKVDAADAPPKEAKSCTLKGKKLWGKVQIVTAFPDIKVQEVKAFPDLKVQRVTAFPDACGKWQYVDAFPDIKIQMVDAFPDLKIQVVDAFPGLP